MAHIKHYNKIKKLKKREHNSTSTLELLFYELKPLIYTALMVMAINSENTMPALAKMAAFGVLAFSALIVYSRLDHRGIINKPY